MALTRVQNFGVAKLKPGGFRIDFVNKSGGLVITHLLLKLISVPLVEGLQLPWLIGFW